MHERLESLDRQTHTLHVLAYVEPVLRQTPLRVHTVHAGDGQRLAAVAHVPSHIMLRLWGGTWERLLGMEIAYNLCWVSLYASELGGGDSGLFTWVCKG